MICLECHQGMVQVHALSQMWEKGYKTIPCPRCNGSGIAYCCDGEDASCDAVTLFSDQSNTIEDTSLVAQCQKGSSLGTETLTKRVCKVGQDPRGV